MSSKTLKLWMDYLQGHYLQRFFQSPKRVLGNYVKPGMTVMDVGAGGGYYSLGMARMVGPMGQVIAVDIDAKEVEGLKNKVAQAGLSDRIDTRVAGERDLGIGELAGHIDFAFARYVVHHAHDADALMGEVYKALKLGGKFLVAEPSHHASPKYCAATEAMAERAGFAIEDHPRRTRDWSLLLGKK